MPNHKEHAQSTYSQRLDDSRRTTETRSSRHDGDGDMIVSQSQFNQTVTSFEPSNKFELEQNRVQSTFDLRLLMYDDIPPTTTPSTTFDFLRNHIQTAFITDVEAQNVLLPIIRNQELLHRDMDARTQFPEGVAYKAAALILPDEDSNRQPTDDEARMLASFFADDFPSIYVCSSEYVATRRDEANWDSTKIIIHGKIEEAYKSALFSSGHAAMMVKASELSETIAMLSFLVVVNIIHEIAHAAHHLVQNNLVVRVDSFDPPYYSESPWTAWWPAYYPEAGFLVEQALFGGQVGIVFKDEINGERPPFFQLDYRRIAYFFLLRLDGKVYHLGHADITQWLEQHRLVPFDISTLVELTDDAYPREPRHRLCAQLNSTHIPRRHENDYTSDPDERIGKTIQDYQPPAPVEELHFQWLNPSSASDNITSPVPDDWRLFRRRCGRAAAPEGATVSIDPVDPIDVDWDNTVRPVTPPGYKLVLDHSGSGPPKYKLILTE